jgi:hypothetical protein
MNRPVGREPSSLGLVDLKLLEAVTLPDADGEQHRLGDLWAERTIILVFLRHFG